MLCFLLVGRKKKRDVARGLFSKSGICLAGCARQDYHGC
jgi:hypothetical protein